MVNRRHDSRLDLDEYLEMIILTAKQKKKALIINDISYSGLRFISTFNLNVEEKITFVVPHLDPKEVMKGKIVWKNELGDSYMYGLEIIRSNISP